MNEVDSFDLGLHKLASHGVQDNYDTALIHSASRVVMCAVRGPMSIRFSISTLVKETRAYVVVAEISCEMTHDGDTVICSLIGYTCIHNVSRCAGEGQCLHSAIHLLVLVGSLGRNG